MSDPDSPICPDFLKGCPWGKDCTFAHKFKIDGEYADPDHVSYQCTTNALCTGVGVTRATLPRLAELRSRHEQAQFEIVYYATDDNDQMLFDFEYSAELNGGPARTALCLSSR